MSAALQLPAIWGAASADAVSTEIERKPKPNRNAAQSEPNSSPDHRLAFYRKHTEKMLRRYLYASMLVGRAPEVLADSVGRGWVSSRPVRTFEDAVIFVLDVEKCLDQLDALDRQILCRIVLQEYTQSEAAEMLGIAVRTVAYRFPQALDRLTEQLLKSGLLELPG